MGVGKVWGRWGDKSSFPGAFPSRGPTVCLQTGWPETRVLRTSHNHQIKSPQEMSVRLSTSTPLLTRGGVGAIGV